MTTFIVHYEWQGSRLSVPIDAGSPEEAAAKLRKQAPGAVINKVKVDRSGTQPQQRATRADLSALSERFKVTPGKVCYAPEYRPNDAASIGEMLDAINRQ